MAKTVIGLFNDQNRARQAMEELSRADIAREDIDLVMPDQRAQLPGMLQDCGVPEDDVHLFDLALQRGMPMILVSEIEDDQADTAAEILDQSGAVDIDRLAPMLRGQTQGMAQGTARGTTQGQGAQAATQRPTPTPGPAAGATPGRTAGHEEIREQVVEEQMRVGKRQVGRGGVRIFSRVTERPVEEQVSLREEHVHVERHPVDRPATAEDIRSAQQGEVEVRATGEEPVVQKQARVVEEVVVSKDVEEHTAEVRDTLKRKDVEVQEIPGQTAGLGAEQLDPEFRRHYQTAFGRTGDKYETIAPAYRYGSQLGADPRFRGRDWDIVRDEAKRDWESRSPGTFERLENAIRYGYDRMRGR